MHVCFKRKWGGGCKTVWFDHAFLTTELRYPTYFMQLSLLIGSWSAQSLIIRSNQRKQIITCSCEDSWRTVECHMVVSAWFLELVQLPWTGMGHAAAATTTFGWRKTKLFLIHLPRTWCTFSRNVSPRSCDLLDDPVTGSVMCRVMSSSLRVVCWHKLPQLIHD